MGLNRQFPNSFAAEVLSGTSTADAVAFGFNATFLRLANLGTTAEVHYNPGSTGAASTSDPLLPIGATIEIPSPPSAGMGFATASTSTSDALKRVSVTAFG